MISFTISFMMSYIMALLAMAFYTLMERKFLGYFQLRKGPNKVGLMGLPQPFADAIKLFTKEQSYPSPTNKIMFMMSPVLGLILALMMWLIYPHTNPSIIMMWSILYFMCVSSMNVYATFLAGWCSNSKYSLLGSLRSIAQTISYEVSMALILLSSLIIHHSMNLTLMNMNMKTWLMMLIPMIAFLWFITNVAETNRTPFDFAEGESELVSGFNTEYSSANFALIFMAEYMNILMMSLLTSSLFIGYMPTPFSNSWLIIVTMIMATLFVWFRATFPRMRYDNLMYLTWKNFLPASLAFLMTITPLTMLM